MKMQRLTSIITINVAILFVIGCQSEKPTEDRWRYEIQQDWLGEDENDESLFSVWVWTIDSSHHYQCTTRIFINGDLVDEDYVHCSYGDGDKICVGTYRFKGKVNIPNITVKFVNSELLF